MIVNGRKFKVRTGCITCKIRKVKCDESKPNCTRCTSTGRKCDGYAQIEVGNSTNHQSMVIGHSNRSLNNSNGNTLHVKISVLPGIESANESRWIEYFSQHAGPAISDLADKEFWTHILPQLSVSEPAIRHALLAVGSSYARLQAYSKKTSILGVTEDDQSIKHYSLAISSLREKLLQPSGDVTVPLICCLLFICLECLHNNQPTMLDHLNNGLKILSSTQRSCIDVNTNQSVKDKLEQIFFRLDTQSTLYGRPMFLPAGDPTRAFYLDIPSTFKDVYEAKMYLDTINSMNLNFIRLASDGVLLDKYSVSYVILLQRRLQEKLITWRNALDNFNHTTLPKDECHMATTTKLRIEYHASFIYLSNCLEMEQTSYDAYKPEFATLISLARQVLPSAEGASFSELATPSTTSSINISSGFLSGFSLQASLIPSLYFTAIKCRDPTIRRAALSLLDRHNGKEGLWDAKLTWQLARRIVEIEEASMLIHQGAAEAYMEEPPSLRMWASNGAVLTDLPDERFRVTDTAVIEI